MTILNLSFFFFPIAMLTSTISGITGMGGGILLLSFMASAFPAQSIIPMHGIIQLISNSSRAFLIRDQIKKQVFYFFLAGLPFGAFLSFKLIKTMPKNDYFLYIILVLLLYTIFKPKKMPALKIPAKGFFLLGSFCGFAAMFTGATGPFLAPFFLRDDWSKQEIVATKASFQTFVHLFKIPVFLSLGFNYQGNALPLLILSIGSIIGTKVGLFLLQKLPDKNFRLIFKCFLIVAAVKIIYKLYF